MADLVLLPFHPHVLVFCLLNVLLVDAGAAAVFWPVYA